MIPSIYVVIGAAMLMGSVLLEVCILWAMEADLPLTYKLFALQDKLIRLVIEGKVERGEPHLEALYRNIDVLLRVCRQSSGRDGWQALAARAKALDDYPRDDSALCEVPCRAMPSALEPVVSELRAVVGQLAESHRGIFGLLSPRRRELTRLQRQQARQFLKVMPAR